MPSVNTGASFSTVLLCLLFMNINILYVCVCDTHAPLCIKHQRSVELSEVGVRQIVPGLHLLRKQEREREQPGRVRTCRSSDVKAGFSPAACL